MTAFPKKKKVKKSKLYSDSYLYTLWRKAVRKHWNNRCALCKTTAEPLECHHFIGRRALLTRWMRENGVLLCKKCHQKAALLDSVERIKALMGEDYDLLRSVSVMTSKDYLSAYKLSDNDFRKIIADELKEYIERRV